MAKATSESSSTGSPSRLRESNCGPRELFSGVIEGEWAEIEVNVKSGKEHLYSPQDTQLCVWRLFSDQEDELVYIDGVQ